MQLNLKFSSETNGEDTKFVNENVLSCTSNKKIKQTDVLRNGNLLSVVCAPEILNPIWVTQKKLSGRESCLPPRAYFAFVGSYAKPLCTIDEDSAA
ncbi:hypothetical protein CEXT_349201 [Caerostris extrusa]|uniref:Uncharacterized protein n=1 Tax=Caerostris extrusa TaxID=172846 RepID=A0AAV4S4W5_CAEEX|nr:hypothetical protein CEXT_349201 [Caerostris extrusa]